MTYVVVTPNEDLLFNCKKQNHLFPSITACKKAIVEDLEEPVAEDGEGRTFCLRDEGRIEKDYTIFRRMHRKGREKSV